MIRIEPSALGLSESSVAYRNVLAEGELSWSSQAPDGFAANALGPQTYDAWVPEALPATLSVTLAAGVECDCAAIVAHNLGSKGATVYVEATNTAPTGWVTLASATPTDDRDLFLLFSDALRTKYTSWRIRITGTAIPAVGIAWIGPRLFVPSGVQASYTPLNMALDVELMPNVTRGGQFLGSRIERVGSSTSIALADQSAWWVANEAADFIAHYNAGKPFLWLSCPEMLPDDAHYVWRRGDVLAGAYGAGAEWVALSMEVSAYVGS